MINKLKIFRNKQDINNWFFSVDLNKLPVDKFLERMKNYSKYLEQFYNYHI
ncbi:hypothetical protein LCGC14_1272420 [marine sediment metagenome]|uniref:Uncharacterized protein n=1 Tax=marine sediment metagenome TaxID=412755 RepID=A0A0F9NEC9_9ZZZZ